jgi:hypothetical protein
MERNQPQPEGKQAAWPVVFEYAFAHVPDIYHKNTHK